MLGEVTCWNTWRSRLDHGDSKPSFGQFLGHPATTGARTNHQNVVNFSPRKEHEPVSFSFSSVWRKLTPHCARLTQISRVNHNEFIIAPIFRTGRSWHRQGTL